VRLSRPDAIALLAVPLAVAAFNIESTVFAPVCMSLAAGLVLIAIARHDELRWQLRITACALIVAVAVGLIFYLYRVNRARALEQQLAPLVAATLPSPVSSNCPIPKGAVALYLGNTVSVVTRFPHVIFKVQSEDVLVVDRNSSGVLVSFRVLDDQGNEVARLEGNKFVATNPSSHVQRPDPSDLAIFDDRDSKVLDVHFLNPQAIKITGILRYPGVDSIVIGEKYLGKGASILPPACRTGTDVDFLFH